MDFFKDDLDFSTFKAKTPLRVIIVGAGIGGLTVAIGLKRTGHDPVLLEQVKEIAEVGAGIQMAPNASRIIGRLGFLDEIVKHMNFLESNSLRRWANDEELGGTKMMPEIGEQYHAPLGVIHRGDFQKVLLATAKSLNIEIHVGTHVTQADSNFEARVQTESGEWITGDVIIAADGIKSTIRAQIATLHGTEDHAVPTGDAAYRVLIPRDQMSHNPSALSLLNKNVGMRWMGPGGHIMAYPIKNNEVYNMVLLHPQKPGQGPEESWTNKGDKREMMEFYAGWNDTVKDLLSYVPEGEVLEWTLNSHLPLASWVENKCVLMGDSCHPMLPYVAQGAAQAIEDAGVLTVVLGMIERKDDVGAALGIYQMIRKERGEKIQNSAATTREALHLPDGPEQQKRDDAFRGKGSNPDLWSDNEWQNYMWGTDVMKDAMENWSDYMSKAQGGRSSSSRLQEISGNVGPGSGAVQETSGKDK